MRTRDIIGLVLSVLTVPLLCAGLIDPLEGGVALIAAACLLVVTWLVSKVPVPRLEWIGWLVAMAVGLVAIALAVTVVNPMGTPGGPGSLPWWLWSLIVGYEVAVVATIAGGVQYVVRHVKALRHGHVRLA